MSVAESLPTKVFTLIRGNTYNLGEMFGLIKISIVNPKTYATPTYIIASGKEVSWINRGWYLNEDDVFKNDNYELIIKNSSETQTFFVTKLS